MTVTWLGGNRVLGLSSERDSSQLFNPTGVGGWVELGRTTLGSASSTIDVSGFASKRYLMLLVDGTPVGSVYHQGKFNNDAGTSYANRRSWNGGGDGALGDRTLLFEGGNSTQTRHFDIHFIANHATRNKLSIGRTVYEGGSGSGVLPHREEFVSKWINNSVPITQYTEVPQLGNLASGAEVVVLGYDPSDTHTTNFWEELASVDLSGGAATTLSSGTIAAKKYLWVQIYVSSMASVSASYLQFNGDTTANYADKINYSGIEDGNINTSKNQLYASTTTSPSFTNAFIINKNGSTKLMVGNTVVQGGTGAGSVLTEATEFAHKWGGTSQITSLLLLNGASTNMGTNTIMKVWGSN